MVGADLVGAGEQGEHEALDRVADLAHRLERLVGGIVEVPVLDVADRVRARVLVVSVIALSACSCISSSIFFGRRPDRSTRISCIASITFGQIASAERLAGRLGAEIRRRVPFEERLRDLGAAGVVGADKQDVAHSVSSSSVVGKTDLIDGEAGMPRPQRRRRRTLSLDLVVDRPHLFGWQVLRLEQMPAEPPHSRSDRTRLLAVGEEREIRPGELPSAGLARRLIRDVDPGLASPPQATWWWSPPRPRNGRSAFTLDDQGDPGASAASRGSPTGAGSPLVCRGSENEKTPAPTTKAADAHRQALSPHSS